MSDHNNRSTPTRLCRNCVHFRPHYLTGYWVTLIPILGWIFFLSDRLSNDRFAFGKCGNASRLSVDKVSGRAKLSYARLEREIGECGLDGQFFEKKRRRSNRVSDLRFQSRKLLRTLRICYCTLMARTFGRYDHSGHDGGSEYAQYQWRGASWRIPTFISDDFED